MYEVKVSLVASDFPSLKIRKVNVDASVGLITDFSWVESFHGTWSGPGRYQKFVFDDHGTRVFTFIAILRMSSPRTCVS